MIGSVKKVNRVSLNDILSEQLEEISVENYSGSPPIFKVGRVLFKSVKKKNPQLVENGLVKKERKARAKQRKKLKKKKKRGV